MRLLNKTSMCLVALTKICKNEKKSAQNTTLKAKCINEESSALHVVSLIHVIASPHDFNSRIEK